LTDQISTRHLVDAEVLPMLELLNLSEFSAETLPAIRDGMDASAALFGEPPIKPVRQTTQGLEGEVVIYWYDPAPGTKDRPALLQIHGGGMVVGSAEKMQFGPSATAAALGIPVASVEYRLAPETPFPGPQEDCYAGLQWLADNAERLGVDPARIGVTGESAGGGLAAAVAQMARDRAKETGKGPKLAAQILVYPMLDHRTGSEACRHNNRRTGEFVWTRPSNRFGWSALQGAYQPNDHRKGWFSPALADDLAGLPPTWIGTGSLDLFFDEDLDYAKRLVDAGVPLELHVYPGGPHAFNIAAEATISQAFNRDMMSAIARLLSLETRP
jgi:acetyl esterase/lipase